MIGKTTIRNNLEYIIQQRYISSGPEYRGGSIARLEAYQYTVRDHRLKDDREEL